MSIEKLCNFNKYGHCMYGITCHKKHVNTIWEKTDCEIEKCEFRHPRKCKFYLQFGRCKFSPCSYKHEQGYEAKLDGLEKLVKEKEVEILSLKNHVKFIDSKLEKLEQLLEDNVNHFDFNLDKIWIDVKATKVKANRLEKIVESYEEESSSNDGSQSGEDENVCSTLKNLIQKSQEKRNEWEKFKVSSPNVRRLDFGD